MALNADAGLALKTSMMEFGVPEDLTFDGSKEQNSNSTAAEETTFKSPEQNQSAQIRTPHKE
jgi:hypothetical protein